MKISIKGDIDTKIPTITREIQDFVICFDAFDKQALRAQLQAKVSAVLTALRIGAAEGYEFRHVSDGSYLTDDSGRIVYSVSMEGGTAELLISRRLTPEQCAQIATDIPLTLKAGTLERVIRLHAQSLNKAIDNYRAFISAWSALEIFIGKLFPAYQRLLSAELRSVNQAPGLHAYLDRIAKVMGDKHNIADKFAVLSVYLDDNQNGDEVRKFLELKSFRDRLSHGC